MPASQPQRRFGVTLQPIGRHRTGRFDADAAEIPAYSSALERLFVVSAEVGGVNVLDISQPSSPERVDRWAASEAWPAAGEVTNVAVHDAVPSQDGGERPVLAAAVVNEDEQAPGRLLLYDADDGQRLAVLETGPEPDCVAFGPEGERVLTADAGAPAEDLEPHPRGTVTLVDLSEGALNPQRYPIGFEAYDGREAKLAERGVRLLPPGTAASRALEPEYVSVDPEGDRAYVVLQANNALATVDLDQRRVTRMAPLGTKDHGEPGQGLDASPEPPARIRPWPVEGLYQPDAIRTVRIDGETLLVSANEGGMVDTDAYSEVARVHELDLDHDAFDLDAFPGVGTVDQLQATEALGQLKVSQAMADPDEDGRHERLVSFGGRSIALWRPDGSLVWDSGADLERVTALDAPEHVNTDGLQHAPFSRSPEKGPEPEGVAAGRVEGHVLAFVGLERTGTIAAYDLTAPGGPRLVDRVTLRELTVCPTEDVKRGDADPEEAGDLGPEGLRFIPIEESPSGAPLLVAAFELSGTTTIFEVETTGS